MALKFAKLTDKVVPYESHRKKISIHNNEITIFFAFN